MKASYTYKFLWSLAVPLIMLASADAEPLQDRARPVHDLRYGAALYDFYQDQYFQAITDIMVAQARTPIERQGNDPLLLLGSLYLSYGMQEAAADIFQPLLNSKTDSYAHDLAWFYVGRMRYMDGDYTQAIEAFRAIHDSLPASKKGESLHLMVNAYLHNGNYGEAIKILNSISSEGIWDYYSRYNLGIALIRSGRIKEGIQLLDQLNRLTPRGEEELALRDKANIAIGFASIRHGTSLDPITSFSRVRLNGPFSNQALLGLGWAYNANRQLHEALKPWTELSARPALDPASQQALIATAYTLEQLKQPRLALSYYDKAVSAYNRIRAELDTALSNVDYVELLRKSIPATFAEEDKWSDATLRSAKLPAAEYLSGLLTSREFQRAYRDYRDLKYLRLQVDKWGDKIPLLRVMLEERRRQYTMNASQTKGLRYSERLRELNSKRKQLANEIADIDAHEKIDALASQEERDRLTRLQEIKDKLDKLASRGLDIQVEFKEQRILYGLTRWKLSTEYPARLWQVKKGLRELDRALAQTDQARSSLENLLKVTPLNFDGFAERITALENYLKDLSERLGVAAKKQEQYCNRLITDTLQQQMQQVDLHRTRALYAQARLYDQLSHVTDAP